MKALVTVELQLCGDLFFSLCRADGIQHQLGTLVRTGLIRNNAVVIEITDDRKIQEFLLGSDVRNMMLGSLYAIIAGPTTLKVPQHAMTLSDFHVLWFVLGIAVMLGLEALKKHMQKAPVH